MLSRFGFSLNYAKWRVRLRCSRIARALRYATDRTTVDDARVFFHDAQGITGYHSLEGLSQESVLELASDMYGDFPELPGLVERACFRVASEWDSSGHVAGHVAGAAQDWAIDLILEYARDAGIKLPEFDAEHASAEG